MTAKTVIIRGPVQKRHVCEVVNALEESIDSPKWAVVIDTYEKVRNAEQNRLYWRWMSFLSKYEFGRPSLVMKDKEYWHAYHAYKYLDPVIVQHPQTGMDIPVPRSTRTLGKKAFSDYLEQIKAEWAEKGVILPTLEDEYYG